MTGGPKNRAGRLRALRKARLATGAGVATCLVGALVLPGLHLLEHVLEEQAAAAALPGQVLHFHRHAPDGSQLSTDDSTPDPDHGHDAISHFGILVLPRATFVVPPPSLPLVAREPAAPSERRPAGRVLSPHAPRGPPSMTPLHPTLS